MKRDFAANAFKTFFLWGVLSALGSACATFTDAALIGNIIGENGLAAANIATPVFMIFAFFGVTMGVGANVDAGNALGRSDKAKANNIFGQLLSAGLVVSGILFAVGLLFRGGILRLFGANSQTQLFANEYAFWVFIFTGAFIFYHILSFSVRIDGDPKCAAVSAGVLITLNIVLDLVFMCVLGSGIVGASLSLCIATLCAVAVLLTHFKKRSNSLKLLIRKPKMPTLLSFFKNGFAVGSEFLFSAIVMSAFNKLLSFGAAGAFNVAVFSVIYTASTFSKVPSDSTSAALNSVVSILSGEKDKSGIISVLKSAVKSVFTVGGIVTALYILLSQGVVRFFGISESQIKTAALSFAVYSLCIVLNGVNTTIISFWQSIGRAKAAATLSVARSFALILILGAVLIPLFGTLGLSIAFLSCEALCFAAAVLVGKLKSSKAIIEKQCSSVERVFENTYAIDRDCIETIENDLHSLSESWQIEPKRSFFIELITEELIANIIKFAVKDQIGKYHISVRLMEDKDDFILRIRDDVADYNPFESDGDDIDNAVLSMIKKKTKRCDYQRKMIFNYLYLVI